MADDTSNSKVALWTSVITAVITAISTIVVAGIVNPPGIKQILPVLPGTDQTLINSVGIDTPLNDAKVVLRNLPNKSSEIDIRGTVDTKLKRYAVYVAIKTNKSSSRWYLHPAEVGEQNNFGIAQWSCKCTTGSAEHPRKGGDKLIITAVIRGFDYKGKGFDEGEGFDDGQLKNVAINSNSKPADYRYVTVDNITPPVK